MPAVNTGLGGPTGHGENSFLDTPLTAGNYDDGAISVDITSVFGPGGIEFFGTNYTELYINTNGLITFDGPNLAYNASDLSSLDEPAIVPFWTDHDLRGGDPAGSNNIYWDLDTVNGTVTITWFEAEPYFGSGANTFQVVLTSEGNGAFGLEYIYETIGFTAGFSEDAQVGVTDGDANDIVVPGSGDPTALTDFDEDNLDPDSPDGTWDIHVNDGNVVCFLHGTLIETDQGPKPVQWLAEGDLVVTADHGLQPVSAVLESRFVACARSLPVCIGAQSLGNPQDLWVSPQHRVLIADPLCELLFGAREVFVAAKHLLGLAGVTQEREVQKLSYYHVLLPRHEVIFANGQASESFFAGDMAQLTLRETRVKMASAVARQSTAQTCARVTLKSYEAAALVAAMAGRQAGEVRAA